MDQINTLELQYVGSIEKFSVFSTFVNAVTMLWQYGMLYIFIYISYKSYMLQI